MNIAKNMQMIKVIDYNCPINGHWRRQQIIGKCVTAVDDRVRESPSPQTHRRTDRQTGYYSAKPKDE